jgi:hypothetical protein
MADSMKTDTERMKSGLQQSENDDDTPLFGDYTILLHLILLRSTCPEAYISALFRSTCNVKDE